MTIAGKITTIAGKPMIIAGKITTIEGKTTTIEGKTMTIEGKTTTIAGKPENTAAAPKTATTQQATVTDEPTDIRTKKRDMVLESHVCYYKTAGYYPIIGFSTRRNGGNHEKDTDYCLEDNRRTRKLREILQTCHSVTVPARLTTANASIGNSLVVIIKINQRSRRILSAGHGVPRFIDAGCHTAERKHGMKS